jgi:hypothetical protein
MTAVARLVVVLPIGPRCQPEFVADTLESVDCYSVPDRRLLLLDNSGRGTAQKFADRPRTEVLVTPWRGSGGALYMSLSAGFTAALREPFDVLLRLDTDALVASAGYETRAAQYFGQHPRTACLGSYRTSYDGGMRSFAPPRRQLRSYFVRRSVRQPVAAARVALIMARALRHGYELGESVLGGACLYSYRGLSALSRAGLLGCQALARTGLEEDHIFALALRSVGFDFAEFGSRDDDLPMGVKWAGLPASPEELISQRKAIIHSTRSWHDLDEAAIRNVFASRRAATSAARTSS